MGQENEGVAGGAGFHRIGGNRTNVLYLRTFGALVIRPDARRVSKARPLSQDQQNTELAIRHLSVPMQDCWSQYWTVHSYVHGWYQTDRLFRIPREPIEVYRHL